MAMVWGDQYLERLVLKDYENLSSPFFENHVIHSCRLELHTCGQFQNVRISFRGCVVVQFDLNVHTRAFIHPSTTMATSADYLKLSPDLYRVFYRYKRATNTVIKWIVTTSGVGDSDGAPRGDRIDRWSLKELTDAACTIKSMNIEAPQDIRVAFEIAIASRTEVTEHIKHTLGDSQVTKSHEHFTNRYENLRTVYKKR